MSAPDPFSNIWTLAEKSLAMTMRAEGKKLSEIGEAIGRSTFAVGMKLRNLCETPKQRMRRLATERRRYKSRVPARDADTIDARPSESELRERDRRLAAIPRDLTAAMFGDPLPGFSALERRA